jgi:putative MATE family efflux protein
MIANLTKAPVEKVLATLMLPMTIGIFSVALFHITNSFFVGKLGSNALAAMGFIFPVITVCTSIAMGISSGVLSVVARTIGEGDPGKVRRLSTDALLLGLLLSVVMALIGNWSAPALFRFLGATPEVYTYIRPFITTWFAGLPLVVVPMIANSIIRASGNTRFPSFMMCVAAAVNLCLSPLLVLGALGMPRLEMEGAALANILAHGTTMLWALYNITVRKHFLTSTPPSFEELRDSWFRFTRIGIAAAASSVIIPLMVAAITRLMSDFGPQAVAAYGVAGRIESFALLAMVALSLSVGPFTGQNWGAKYRERVWRGLWIAVGFCVFWGAAMVLLFHFYAPEIVHLFNTDPRIVKVALLYLAIVPIGYAGQGMMMNANGMLNALAYPYPYHATAITFARAFVLYLPLAALGKHWIGMEGIFYASAGVNLVLGIASMLWVRHVLRNYRERPLPFSKRPLPLT